MRLNSRSPTHAGGLLAIDRQWFFELGAYDPGIKVWGAEQYVNLYQNLTFETSISDTSYHLKFGNVVVLLNGYLVLTLLMHIVVHEVIRLLFLVPVDIKPRSIICV